METMNFENIIGAVNGDETHVLGKFLYFSLSHLLVEKDELAALCDSLNIPHSVGSRVSVSDAFRSATGDIRDRLVSQQSGEAKIYAIYCRDNERKPDMYSRELVKETLNERTNQYQKLANLHYDRTDGSFGYADLSFDADVDALKYCQRAEELFELSGVARTAARLRLSASAISVRWRLRKSTQPDTSFLSPAIP